MKEKDPKKPNTFNEKYGKVIQELAGMPSSTKEDKRLRWKFILQLRIEADQTTDVLNYDTFVMECFRTFKPAKWNKLAKNLADVDKTVLDDDKEDLDSLAFMEALQETVETYSQSALDNGIAFSQWVGENYKHKQKTNKCVTAMDEKYPYYGEATKRKKLRLYKAINTIKKEWEQLEAKEKKIKSFREMAVEVLKDISGLSKKDILDICMLAEALSMVSVDDELTSDDGEAYSMEDVIGYKTYLSEKNREDDQNFDLWMHAVLQYLSDNFAEIKNATDKKSYDLLKVFMTRDILVELKLELMGDDYLESVKKTQGKNYSRWLQSVKEPRCTSWCHRVGHCLKNEREKGCYRRYTEEPAGDLECYEMLKPYEGELYRHVFHREYLEGAFGKEPENFFKVYYDLLRKDFDFTDREMAKSIHLNKERLSRAKKKYENETRDSLYNYCKKMIN